MLGVLEKEIEEDTGWMICDGRQTRGGDVESYSVSFVHLAELNGNEENTGMVVYTMLKVIHIQEFYDLFFVWYLQNTCLQQNAN